jgi:hypothetical protein
MSMSDSTAPHADPAEDAPLADPAPRADLAPRARPGFKSRPAPSISTTSMAGLFAGVVRAVVGLLGFTAALQLLPVHMATPILAGVSVLLVVTGNVSAWRALDGSRALRLVFRTLVAISMLVLLAVTVATATLGAGALRKRPLPPPDEGPPTVRFEMTP